MKKDRNTQAADVYTSEGVVSCTAADKVELSDNERGGKKCLPCNGYSSSREWQLSPSNIFWHVRRFVFVYEICHCVLLHLSVISVIETSVNDWIHLALCSINNSCVEQTGSNGLPNKAWGEEWLPSHGEGMGGRFGPGCGGCGGL